GAVVVASPDCSSVWVVPAPSSAVVEVASVVVVVDSVVVVSRTPEVGIASSPSSPQAARARAPSGARITAASRRPPAGEATARDMAGDALPAPPPAHNRPGPAPGVA